MQGLLGLAVGAQHVHDLVYVEFLHLVAGGTQVLAGVELAGLLVEDLAHGGGHGETAVAVDVDLADGALGGFAELFLGDTYSIGQFAAVGVDDVNILLRNGAGAVENGATTLTKSPASFSCRGFFLTEDFARRNLKISINFVSASGFFIWAILFSYHYITSILRVKIFLNF